MEGEESVVGANCGEMVGNEESKDEEEDAFCTPCGMGENEDKENEGIKVRIPRRPTAPTKAEIEEHEATHFPPRDWCPHCVAGHGISNQHRKSHEKEEDKIGNTIGMDYCFMREGEK